MCIVLLNSEFIFCFNYVKKKNKNLTEKKTNYKICKSGNNFMKNPKI